MSNHRICCCPSFCTPGFRYVQIQPIMFPDKFMAYSGEYSPHSLSFWIRYEGTCDPDSKDVVVIQTFLDSDAERVIRIGDTTTKFMTDLGRAGGESPELTRYGITRPGDNQTATHYYYMGSIYDGDVEPSMDPAEPSGARNIAFNMWHRNCFTLASEEYLTEEEWLARSDYRAVFQRSDGVATPETIRQQGVHIFTDDQPFQELDLIPYKYSPALHCIPDRTVGGVVFEDDNPEDAYLILYDYKDHYPDQVGVVVASSDYEEAEAVVENGCNEVTCPAGTMQSRQYVAYRTLKPNPPIVQLPFEVEARLSCPVESWDVPIENPTQTWEPDSGDLCEDADPYPECGVTEYCHDPRNPSYVGYGKVGSITVESDTQRTVAQDSVLRNCLFVRSIWWSFDGYYAYCRSQPGSDDFEDNDFITTTEAHNFNANFFGLQFGFPLGSDLDPNPPDQTDGGSGFVLWSRNLTTEFPPWACGCDEGNVTVLNNGAIDGIGSSGSLQVYKNGNWVEPSIYWSVPEEGEQATRSDSFFTMNTINPRIIGQPQFSFP